MGNRLRYIVWDDVCEVLEQYVELCSDINGRQFTHQVHFLQDHYGVCVLACSYIE